MKRRLLIVVDVPDNTPKEDCGRCPFIKGMWDHGVPSGLVCDAPQWKGILLPDCKRHKACLEAEEWAYNT